MTERQATKPITEKYFSGEKHEYSDAIKNKKEEEDEIDETAVEIEGVMNEETTDTGANTQMMAGVHVVDTKGEPSVLAETFDMMGLRKDILKGIYSMGFEKPSPIQMTAVLPLMGKRDVRAQAQSGTGKTAAFGIASLQRVDASVRGIQVVILENTRELAIQTSNVLRKLAAFTSIKIEAVYGGVPIRESEAKIHSNPHILVATPGRFKHAVNACKISLKNVKLFILDEADEMLKRGFQEDVHDIYKLVEKESMHELLQVGLFSATWGEEEQKITEDILIKPVIISLKDDDQTLKGIKQYYVNIGERRGGSADLLKLDALCDIYSRSSIAQSVVFCNRVERAIELQKSLEEKGFECMLFHSELTQEERNRTLKLFIEGKCRMLISSGLLSRGMDVQTLSMVINYDVPGEKEIDSYIHRIGRAGRFGRRGVAINFVSADDADMIKKYETHYNTRIAPLPQDVSEVLNK
ncbi:hypothetical protein NECID01_0481 [Nematocida sp. AWRm77]|nr:hypothetical protein NECID01_0481 [Nematocida sp. AWRm77]